MLSDLARRIVSGPVSRGPLEGATHYGESDQPGEGPYIQIWLTIEGDKVHKAAFKSPGCPSSTAAAGVLCTLVTGREVEKAALLSSDDLLNVVGELPEGKGHYIDRSIRALRRALGVIEA